MKKKILHIISATFPFGNGEQFFESEVMELSRYFDQIVIYPTKIYGTKKNIPENAVVNSCLCAESTEFKKELKQTNTGAIFKEYLKEVFGSDKMYSAIKNYKYNIAYIRHNVELAEVFWKQINQSDQNYFYSFWMNEGAMIFSLLKNKGLINRFYFRVNGYDIFEERSVSGYLPFRNYNFSRAYKIIVLSEVALDYLKKQTAFGKKLVLNYYGTYDKGLNVVDEDKTFTIVSCSGIVALKRMDKIVSALKHVNFPVRWVHFGDGALRKDIESQAAGLPANISYEFMGNVKNDVIIDFYKSESVNLFIHMSDTEGLGMALIEAQSFGIPCLAVASGGVVNIVNERTGILVNHETSSEEIAQKIDLFRSFPFNTPEYRHQVKGFWESRFNAKNNYFNLAQEFIEDHG